MPLADKYIVICKTPIPVLRFALITPKAKFSRKSLKFRTPAQILQNGVNRKMEYEILIHGVYSTI